MHRSGTSAVTRAIHLLGYRLGPTKDLMPATKEQPRGYWELETMRRRNDELLHMAGGSWDNPPSPPLPRFPSPPACRRLIEDTFGDVADCKRAPWVWKDPRNCLLFPHWWAVLKGMGFDPHLVFVYRHPYEVAESLATRGIEKARGLALWELYNERALESMAGLPVTLVEFDRLLAAPQAIIGSLAGRVQSDGDMGAAVESISPQAVRSTSRLGHGGGALYQGLRSLSFHVERLPSLATIKAPNTLASAS